jgi:hypothetical protein
MGGSREQCFFLFEFNHEKLIAIKKEKNIFLEKDTFLIGDSFYNVSSFLLTNYIY